MEFTFSLTSVIASGKGTFSRLCSGTGCGTNLCASNEGLKISEKEYFALVCFNSVNGSSVFF